MRVSSARTPVSCSRFIESRTRLAKISLRFSRPLETGCGFRVRSYLSFQRNRRAVIREQEDVYGRLDKELASFPDRILGKVRQHHPRIDRDELKAVIDSAVTDISNHINTLRAAHPDPLTSTDVLGADVVRDRLEEIVGDRIGDEFDPSEAWVLANFSGFRLPI